MATLIQSKKEWAQNPGEDFMDYMHRIDAVCDEIRKAGNLFQSPIADGYACYEIVSRKPLKLRHIPVGDAWHIPASHMRGLRLSDIEAVEDLEKLFKQ